MLHLVWQLVRHDITYKFLFLLQNTDAYYRLKMYCFATEQLVLYP